MEWLNGNPAPDLILMDIELADGQSFAIFNHTEVKSPVIFTTSYDEYALKAFKVNSIDYLLKPVQKEDLEAALKKFHALKEKLPRLPGINLKQIVKELQVKIATQRIQEKIPGEKRPETCEH